MAQEEWTIQELAAETGRTADWVRRHQGRCGARFSPQRRCIVFDGAARKKLLAEHHNPTGPGRPRKETLAAERQSRKA